MAAKAKAHPLNGMHTAGIYSDMTIDGPPIGTLVVVVDRAKNLPNRKTIGKQDPYCAARLGKEARKTNTDIRGGQTPKWDQELRFNVHDSPDYYQLKVSVFNDDKKTDLIGEAWIDLREVVVPGGGQNDLWHQLTCKGKYAGDIRIEITYYDTRPKPEKPAVKARQPGPSEVDGSRSQQRSVPKRRPLPSDPVTGKVPVQQTPDFVQTPQRPQPNPSTSYVPNQSPLQQVEYKTPPPASSRYQQQDHQSPGLSNSGYGAPVQRAEPSMSQYHTPEQHDRYSVHPDDISPNYRQQSYERQNSRHGSDAYMLQMSESPAPLEDDRPPPPPVHRSRNNSGMTQEQGLRNSFDSVAAKGTPPTMRQDVLRNEAHRRSVPATYPGRPTYKAYDSAPAAPAAAQFSGEEYHHHSSPPAHYAYDPTCDLSNRSMQPTVEDAPDSPDNMLVSSFRRSGSRMPQYEPEFDPVASPAPLNVGSRGRDSGRDSTGYYNPNAYQSSDSAMISRDLDHPSQATSDSYNAQGQLLLPYRSELDDTSNTYDLPPVPASLVPGMDPSLVQEISHRINEDRRMERHYTQPAMSTPPRGRQMNGLPSNYASNGSPVPYTTPPQPQHHSRSPVPYSGGSTTAEAARSGSVSPMPQRDLSPNPRHTIRRKSISPAPPLSDGRRLSGVPFGPDSYDALNPSLPSATSEQSVSRPDYNESRGKIITYDGREVDPSDHLPMDTWAPEPEPKNKKPPGPSSSRPSPGGPQALPPSGRRQLRIAGRPQSMAPSSGYISQDISFADSPAPSTPASTGRNRLQKKSNRASAMPVMAGANGSPGGDPFASHGSSPLAPLPHHQDNFTPPRTLARASTFDYPSENHAPMYGSSPGERTRAGTYGGNNGPPIPAKVPLALTSPPSMSGALPASRSMGYDEWGSAGAGGGDLSLLEEMRQIDIGTGRSRRRGHGYGHGY
ncbi:hypothetical protein QBC33DRAFT_217338 [Phialemonium atrogriseum]|uniref:C2 domain-containing protein n=1 Tax=Phialemonium atrogriseum TaxID=1093897 RepID=A0AAJ0C8W6_9PEZI|nr:uncharacterized protein QBC33DRAFT_217338 [Phialemonium atrogriseum]KAK1770809.1 hypothetical protein QBC33DRAFT_217338 [Phialemonium atrogriseum]